MPSHIGEDSEEDDDDDVGIDEGFQKHLDALKQACLLSIGQDTFVPSGGGGSDPGTPSSALDEDDEELFESIQKKYFSSSGLDKDSIPQRRAAANSDDEEEEEDDDEEILRSVEKLYGGHGVSKLPQLTGNVPELETLSPPALDVSPECNSPEESSARPGKLESSVIPAKDLGRAVSSLLPSNWTEEDDPEFASSLVLPTTSHIDSYESQTDLLSSAEYEQFSLQDKERIIAEVLQKNRSYQQKLRNVLSRIEAKEKQNAEMQRRVRTLLDFEKFNKRRFANFFTDQANPSLKLFSVKGGGYRNKSEVNDKNDFHGGPPDNPDVEGYKILKQKAMIASMSRKWKVDEIEELAKGVKQQVNEMLVCQAMDAISNGDLTGDNALEDALDEIRKKDLTPEELRDAIGGVNWDQVARVYVPSRTPEECRTRWLNHEDPIINRSSWTKIEDKKLLSIVQQFDTTNWEKIAQELGTNRTPAECLTRYQRSLNASILRTVWTPEEDNKLRAAVEVLGESDWSAVAACLEGRNNSQCLMRWYKVLHPTKQKKGRWSLEEDKRLNWAVSVYGAKKWKQIANHVPGRTDIQCRERWCNVLNPEIKLDTWTEEEDKKLQESIAQHGPHRWSAVAADLKVRTDKQCWRRWKFLFPEDQPDYQRTVYIQRNALVNNFQGRKKERPKLGPQDFVSKVDGFEVTNRSTKGKTKAGSKTKLRPVRARKEGSVPDDNGNLSSVPTSASGPRESELDQNKDLESSLIHGSNTLVGGSVEGVRGDDALSDSKMRRLARIHKLKLARASKLAANGASKAAPNGVSSATMVSDHQTDRREMEPPVPSSSFQAHLRKRKRHSRTDSFEEQHKPNKRSRQQGAKKGRPKIVSDGGAPSRPSPSVDTSTAAGVELPAAKALPQTTEGSVDRAERNGTLENTVEPRTGKRKKRPSVGACADHSQVSRGARSTKTSLLPEEVNATEVSQPVRPDIMAFVDLLQSVADFCKYSSLIHGEQHPPAFQDPPLTGLPATASASNRSGGADSDRSGVADSDTDVFRRSLFGSIHHHCTPLVGTETIYSNGNKTSAERRMVTSTVHSGGRCDAPWCPNSTVNRVIFHPGSAADLETTRPDATTTSSETQDHLRDKRTNMENAPNVGTSPDATTTSCETPDRVRDDHNELTAEDEEVAAATRAILSWPFFYGVQHLTHQATDYLEAKAPRKTSGSKPRKKSKAVDPKTTAGTEAAAVESAMPTRRRSARCGAKMRQSM